MFQFLYFLVIYSILLFIWSYILANTRKDNLINRAFLVFLGLILLWLLLNRIIGLIDGSYWWVILNNLYFWVLMNLAISFLYFTYRLLQQKLDRYFWGLLVINSLTLVSRYGFPIDYSIENFWRMDDVFWASLMAFLFTLPMLLAIFMLILHWVKTKDQRLRHQLVIVGAGIVSATLVSIVSEYLLPVLNTTISGISLMYVAYLVLIGFLFIAVLQYQFLGVREEYIYQNLFLYSNEGIIMVDVNCHLLMINEKAKAILKIAKMDNSMKITHYLKNYEFSLDYHQNEMEVEIDGEKLYLLVSQSLINTQRDQKAKLLHIIDNTSSRIATRREKEILLNQTTRDPLTGIYNRRFYDDQLVNRNWVDNHYTVVLFMDIDNFKFINDNYGHQFGDEVLKSVAFSVREVLRLDELLIRYGGDEFVVVLTSNVFDDAEVVAARIHLRIGELRFDLPDKDFKITLSIGIAGGNEKIDRLIQKADQAMYQAKAAGKGQTVLFDEA